MANGGESANRGFIFQAIIALIEYLDPKNEWDQIKNEPVTKDEKVDIMLYKDGKPKSAIQVKSSINDFNKPAVERWLESLKADAEEAEKVCLCLVGDKFTSQCRAFIEEHRSEVKTVSFENLQRESTFQLIGYIKRAGLGEKSWSDSHQFF